MKGGWGVNRLKRCYEGSMSSLGFDSQIPAGCAVRCPACHHRGLGVSESLALKREMLERALSRPVMPVRSADASRRLGYRERTLLHARWLAGAWAFGMLRGAGRDWRQGVEPEWVSIPDCPVHSERVRRVLAFLGRSLAASAGSTLPLVFVSISGSLAALVLKCSRDQAIEAGVLSSLANIDWINSGLEGVHLNFNPSAGHRVFASGGWQKLWGADRARGPLGLMHGVQAFHQLIPELYEASLDEALRHLAPGPASAILDLYCGMGASLRRWPDVPVMAVELGGESIACAHLNLRPSQVAGTALLRGRCSDRLPQIEEWASRQQEAGREVLAYVNPPRTGLESSVLDWLGGWPGLTRIAYLSCSPGTLARDLARFEGLGMQVSTLVPFDFFPQTHHVETLVGLVRGPVKDPGETRL
jgi:23S rRNA (uracil1939-C5)-methyltransferase